VLTGWQATSPAADEARRRTLALLTDGPGAMTRAHRPGHVTASTLIAGSDGRLLLCLHGKLNKWMQVGGHCEDADATLAGAALREATEESGIAGLVIDPDPIDVHIHEVPCGFHHDVRFLAYAPAGVAEQVSAESHALGWFTADALPDPLADGVVEQIGPALARLR